MEIGGADLKLSWTKYLKSPCFLSLLLQIRRHDEMSVTHWCSDVDKGGWAPRDMEHTLYTFCSAGCHFIAAAWSF